MTLPETYTQTHLADWLLKRLGPVADVLGWSAMSFQVVDAIEDALIAYGVDEVPEATNVPKLRALARRELWRQVADSTVGYHDFTSSDQSFKLQQIHEQAVAALRRATLECQRSGYAASAYVGTVRRVDNAYRYLPDTERGGF
jgi:hypothetical protein